MVYVEQQLSFQESGIWCVLGRGCSWFWPPTNLLGNESVKRFPWCHYAGGIVRMTPLGQWFLEACLAFLFADCAVYPFPVIKLGCEHNYWLRTISSSRKPPTTGMLQNMAHIKTVCCLTGYNEKSTASFLKFPVYDCKLNLIMQ